jgi:hypothetical protein
LLIHPKASSYHFLIINSLQISVDTSGEIR